MMAASKTFKLVRYKYRGVLWRIIRYARKSIIVKTKQGLFYLPLQEDEPITRSLYIKKEYEQDLVTQVLSLLRQLNKCAVKGNGTIVDIGANNGVISIGMLVQGEFEKAVAIEPEASNFNLLQKNVKLNGLGDDIACLNYAVSDEKSTLTVELSDTNSGDHRIRIAGTTDEPRYPDLYNESERKIAVVQSDTLESLLQDCNSISLIWVDVQGHEGYVLKGAKKLLSNDIPVVVELWPYGIQRAGMSQKEFCDLASEIWTSYWVLQQNKFVCCPMSTLVDLIDEIGYGRDFANVIFMH